MTDKSISSKEDTELESGSSSESSPKNLKPPNLKKEPSISGLTRTTTRASSHIAFESDKPDSDEFSSDQERNISELLADTDVLERLDTLSKKLSRHTANDEPIEINSDDFDLKTVLKSIIHSFDKEGIKTRYSGVRFRGITVYGIDQAASIANTVGIILLGFLNIPKMIKDFRHPPIRKLIQDFDGVVREGEMLLVLGRPGAGCTTFLRSIAGEVDQYKGAEGDISYDGVDQKTMLKDFKGDIIYNSECKQ